jgi:hypothetical protein
LNLEDYKFSILNQSPCTTSLIHFLITHAARKEASITKWREEDRKHTMRLRRPLIGRGDGMLQRDVELGATSYSHIDQGNRSNAAPDT